MKNSIAFALLSLLMITNVATATIPMSLSGQLTALADDVKQALEKDPRVKGQALALGDFSPEGPKVRSTNYGSRIKRELQKLLEAHLKSDAELTLAGSYHFVDSETDDNRGAEVLVVTVQIKNKRGKEIIPFEREVNDTDDIRAALGTTGAGTTAESSFKQNNDELKRDVTQPQFALVGTDRVAAQGRLQYSVRLLKKARHDGPTTPVPPQNANGLAFVAIDIREYYEIELFNDDTSDAVAIVTVDGLDVANTFATDKSSEGKPIVWPGYFIPRAENGKPGRIVIRGWLHSIRPEVKDNVFSFLITELGKGAASALKQCGEVGVITVQFHEARPPGEKLTGHSRLETAKGEGLQERYTTKQVVIGGHAESTVSLRYNVPQP